MTGLSGNALGMPHPLRRFSFLFALLWAWCVALPMSTLAEPGLVIVSAREWGSKPLAFPAEMKQIPQRIVLHHAGVAWKPGGEPRQKLRDLQAWGQKEKGWLDVPYHYVISPDGQIFEGRDWRFQPDSNTSYSLNGVLNVELFGNFETELVSAQQLDSLVDLLAYLHRTHSLNISSLTSHREMAPGQTVCPGRDLQRYLDGPLRDWVRQGMRGEAATPKFWLVAPPEGKL